MALKGRKLNYKKAGKSSGKLSGRRIDALLLEKYSLDLRIQGLTYDQIADELEKQNFMNPNGGFYTQPAIYQAVKRAVQKLNTEVTETAKHSRTLELRRLDKMLQQMMAQAIAGDQFAVDRVIKIMERRAKYLGLDAPTKTALTDPSGNEPLKISVIDSILQDSGESLETLQNTETPEE